MLSLHLLVLLLCYIRMEAMGAEDFPTVDEAELITHELINPFTPYFRDPKYHGKIICKGFSTWQDALFGNYKKLKTKFARNCSHILGNLIVSEIRPNEDVEFLNTIEEVSGYVFIRRVTKPHFALPNLRIIRGEESVQIRGQSFTLLVTETYTSDRDFMSDIEFPSLEAILMHGVGFFDNPGLCYAPFSVNWDDILEYPDLQPVMLVPMNGRSATSHWVTACATRYGNASKVSILSTTPSSSVNMSNGERSTAIQSSRLRRKLNEDVITTVALDNAQPSHAMELMTNDQPIIRGFSTLEINPIEVVSTEVMDNVTQNDDENPKVSLETTHQEQLSTSIARDSEKISSEFKELSTNEMYPVLWNLSSGNGPWVKWKCHDNCSKQNGRSFCWGPGADQCQILRKCQTRVCSGPNRCVKEGGVEECCHDECVGGCNGTRANECLACRRYSHEGNCVSACPATRFYDVHTSSWKVNKEGRVTLGHMCVSKCPDGFLRDGDHCVLKCSRPGTQQVHNVCVQCPPTGCPKTCSGKQLQLPSVDFLHKSLLRKMVNCTFWEGSIILKRQSFEGDAFHHLTKEEESVTFEDLQSGLGSLFEITGVLYVGTDNTAPWLKNLTFLSKLRHIGGEVPPGYTSPLKIVHNNYLEYLGLASLVYVGVYRGTIQIVQNPKLCLADTVNWRSLMWAPKTTTNTTIPIPVVVPIRTVKDCVSKGFQCDTSVCELSQGCWGPGPENCRLCAHWLIQGRGETSRCVLNCSLADGGYYPVMITKPIDKNIALKIKSCSKCHKECGSMPGACNGPDANHCNYGCAHVKDGNFCRTECPLGKFPNEENICYECAAVCTSHPRGVLDSTESSNWSAVCTGPGDWFGHNGCSQCIQVVAAATTNEEHGLRLKCLTPYQPCPKRTFLHLIGGQKRKMGDPKLAISGDVALSHVPHELQEPLGDWLSSHQLQSASINMVRVCAPCHPECQDGCSGPSPNQCVRCRNAQFNGICVASCHEGTYEANLTSGGKQCRPCHDQCSQSCSGPLSSDCLFCQHYKRYLNKEKTKWICVESCPPDSIAHVELNSITTAVEFVCLHTGISHHLPPAISGKIDECLIFCTWSEIISPRLLNHLSWLSTALLIFCGLLALFVAVYFGYMCSRIVIHGRKSRSEPVVDQLQSGRSSMCSRFWMRAVVVAELEEKKNNRTLSKSRRNISLRSLSVTSDTLNGDEQSHLVSSQADTMPDMTTLLIIPEYQLKLGNRVGGGAFGSVYRGIWYKGPISPEFAKKVDDLFTQAAKVELEKPKLVPLDSLVEDNAYASTEQEYLTMEEEEEEKEAKEAQNLEKSVVLEEKTELKPLLQAEKPIASELNITSSPAPQTGMFRFSEDCKEEREKFYMENVEEHVVAIKVLTDETDPFTSKALLDEARVMATVNHPCCLRLLALCMTARPQLVTPFLPLGCLLSYLHRHGGPNAIDCDVITPEIMLNWANQIASGMAYLASRSIIHRDLAARNVLVETPEQIKITDFGLAKCIEDTDGEYTAKGGLMPVKWLAIECIKKRIFSSKSDVWAYGVTLWEIFTLGRRPYERTHTRHLIQYLERGLRLVQPMTTSLELYKLMVECWQGDPNRRPSFDELFQRISLMQLNPLAFINFKRVRGMKKNKQGRICLWGDSGLMGSTSSYVATTINTTVTTGNTSTIVKSTSEVSVPTSTSSCLNYLAEVTEKKEDVRYTSSPRDDCYGIIMPTSSQRQDPVQPLECIVEDVDETSALENDYEKPIETVQRVDPFPPNDIAPAPITAGGYLGPREEINQAEPEEVA